MRIKKLRTMGLFGLMVLSAGLTYADEDSWLPPDVARFVANRDLCDHFRGEEAYDEARQQEIEQALDRYCTGTDYQLNELKIRYQRNQAVSERLDQYDENIEVEDE